MSKRTVTVHEVLFDGASDGPACDGTHIRRFAKGDARAAETFAAANTCYGRPTSVSTVNVSVQIARRWGFA